VHDELEDVTVCSKIQKKGIVAKCKKLCGRNIASVCKEASVLRHCRMVIQHCPGWTLRRTWLRRWRASGKNLNRCSILYLLWCQCRI